MELGLIEMGNRHIELELLSQIGISWVNGPIVARMAAGRFPQIPEAKALSDERVRSYYARLDGEFESREYVAASRFSIADITTLIAIDFASAMVDLQVPAHQTTAATRRIHRGPSSLRAGAARHELVPAPEGFEFRLGFQVYHS